MTLSLHRCICTACSSPIKARPDGVHVFQCPHCGQNLMLSITDVSMILQSAVVDAEARYWHITVDAACFETQPEVVIMAPSVRIAKKFLAAAVNYDDYIIVDITEIGPAEALEHLVSPLEACTVVNFGWPCRD